jgi:hypothetical protein
VIDINDENETERGEQCADRHDAMATVAIDQQANPRRDHPGGEQGEREAAHGKCHGPAALGRNERDCQHRWIEDRAPGENLRDAEHQDGAPGTGDDIAKRGHDERRREWDWSLARLTPASI